MTNVKKDNIRKLTDYQHARLRTEMYLGSRSKHTQDVLVYEEGKPVLKEMTWTPAFYTAVREAIDNAVDEVIGHGQGSRIDISYDPKTLQVTVEDDGRGIPIDYDESHKEHLATTVLTHARAGRNFDERENVVGTNGLGISICVFCSEWFEVEIHRSKQRFTQRFEENPIAGNDSLRKGRPVLSNYKGPKTGTKVSFKLSSKVFKELILPEEFVRSRVYEIALSNPLIKIYYNGERLKVSPYVEKTLFPDIKPVILDVKAPKLKSKFFIVPEFCESGEFVHSLVNNIPAFNGGVHIDTFRKLFYNGLLSALEKEGKRRKVMPNRSDITEGLLIYNITQMEAPDFDSQSKTRLINEWVGDVIKANLSDEELYKSVIKKNREWIEQIFTRAEERTNKKDLDETKKAAKAAKRSKVADLMDASGRDRSKCILFLAEGQSAIGGISEVRDPNIHGGLGLRGKVLNVDDRSAKDVLNNEVLVSIMNSIGLMIGEKAERSYLRYGKVYLATDMDPDGFNIAALLVNFFYKYWPELFDPKKEPYVHVFMTPFIIVEKGKTRHYWYGEDKDTFKPEDWKGCSITRAKGLGSLVKQDWEHSLKNIKAIPIIDDGKMKESLDLIFNGSRADDRKEWLGI